MTAPDERAALYEGIDRVVLPVSDMAGACAPFERLGLVVSPEIRPRGRNVGIRTLPVGGPDNLFGVEFLSTTEPTNVVAAGGLSAIVLRVADMATTLGALAERGIQATAQEIYGADGFKRLDLAVLPDLPDAAVSLRLIQPARTAARASPSTPAAEPTPCRSSASITWRPSPRTWSGPAASGTRCWACPPLARSSRRRRSCASFGSATPCSSCSGRPRPTARSASARPASTACARSRSGPGRRRRAGRGGRRSKSPIRAIGTLPGTQRHDRAQQPR